MPEIMIYPPLSLEENVQSCDQIKEAPMLEMILWIMCSRNDFISVEPLAAGWRNKCFIRFETLRWEQRWEFEA